MMRFARRTAYVVGGGYLLLVAVLKVYVVVYWQPEMETPVSAIVVLSAGPVNSERDNRTAVRTYLGVKLYNDLSASGTPPKLVFAGGQEPSEREPKAVGMAVLAREAGVPEQDIVVEGRSRSTLQNAMFSLELLQPGDVSRIVVITDRFHLPRSWASFKWAGAADIELLSADPPGSQVDWDNLFREAMKWPVNIARAVAFSVLSALGWAERDLVQLTT